MNEFTLEELLKEEWMRRNDNMVGRVVFPIIRRESKYCSRCGAGLDLYYKDWHMPFCNSCRKEIIKSEINQNKPDD